MPDWPAARPLELDAAAAPHSTDEAALVARARQDRRAFAPLYRRYLDPVYRYCYRRLGTREAAEDATSQAFLNALAALPGYRGTSFRAWLFAIAHNVVVDVFRQRASAPLAEAGDVADGALTPEEVAVAADEGRTLRALLASLPDDQRSVVELRLAGLTGAEVAVALGRSLGAVKMLHFRAVARLRTVLSVGSLAGGQGNGRA